jgi:cytoskeleton protein RodZ
VRAVVEPVRTVVEPVRADVRIAAATPTPTQQEISEEALVAEALAAAPLIEQTPLAAPAPRVVPTEPAFLAAERAQAKEREERRRRELAAEEVQRTGNQSAAAVRPPTIAPYSDGIDVAELLPAPEPQTSSQDAETIRLAAARRISELTNDDAAANGAVRSFPVPPPIPAGTQTAALDRTGGYVPQVFGASNGDSRVIIEAKLESWVQVRGLSGETLLTRILRVGDKYLVPNRPNLVMMTGNAGALKIIVDGKEIGPLGPPGAVLRDVSLEPSQLLARAAAQ